MLRDWKYAARLLRKTPGFTLTATLILATAIAGNTAAFSAANALLLEQLPFTAAERLIVIATRHRTTGARAGLSLPEYQEWTRDSDTLAGAAAVELEQGFNVSDGAEPIRVTGGRMSASLLPLLGVTPIRGRGFIAGDERPGAPNVVLITDRLWATRFNRAEDVVGRAINVDGRPAAIIGVLPADFRLLYGGYSLWVPLRPDLVRMDRTRRSLLAIARLPAGATIDSAASALSVIASHAQHEHPLTNADWRVSVSTLREFLLAGRGHTLLFVMTALALLLLVACANVASLQLARAAARHQEIATRLALGASRWRVVRLLLAEASVVASFSGMLAMGIVALLRRVLLASSPDLRELAISVPALLFTLGLMFATTVAFGLVPALTATRVDLTGALKETASSPRATRRLRSALVVAELSCSLVLLVPAGLLFRSFMALRQAQPGFRVENVLTFSVALTPAKYPDAARQRAFQERALARLTALSRVQFAAATDALPLEIPAPIDVQGAKRENIRVLVRSISPGFLRTFEIPLTRGRDFEESDAATAPCVALVNETLAAMLRSDRDVIGEVVRLDGGHATIVGVVGDLRSLGLRTPARPEVLLPLAQRPAPTLAFALATAAEPRQSIDPARTIIRDLDPDLPIAYVRPLADLVDEQFIAIRTIALLLAALAALALLLAAAGLAGIMSWLVTARTREIGVRAALGASRRDTVMLVLRDAAVLIAWGVGVGLPAALAIARLVANQLWGVRATDAAVFVTIAAVLCAVAFAACYGPARRAADLQPATALRAN